MSLNGKVPPELKIQAVEDYLSAGGSLGIMCRRGKRKSTAELSDEEKAAARLRQLEAENQRHKMENDFLKIERNRRRVISGRIRQTYIYKTIHQLHEKKDIPFLLSVRLAVFPAALITNGKNAKKVQRTRKMQLFCRK